MKEMVYVHDSMKMIDTHTLEYLLHLQIEQ